jgi:hypothetical protein
MNIKSEDLLLSERLAPITSRIGFIETELGHAVQDFVAWQNEIKARPGISASSKRISGGLEQVLKSLLPLKVVQWNRCLFIPTASYWTAYFDNGYRGTDPSAIIHMARRLRCRTIWIVAKPHTLQKIGTPRRGRQGALVLELYGPEETDRLNLIRQIRLQNDAGKWEFMQHGAPLPFEDTSRYSVKRTSERFPFDLFSRYLQEFGIAPFDPGFYLPVPDEHPTLVELEGPIPENSENVSLKRARRLNGIEDGLRIRGRLVSRRGFF